MEKKLFFEMCKNMKKKVHKQIVLYSYIDLLVSDTWLDTGIGYWYRYPMTRYYERLLDTRSS